MAKRHATRRRVSAGAALVTGLGTLGLGLFAAAPAQADVTNTLNYTCSVTNQGLEETFTDLWVVDLTIGAPDQVEPGAEIPAPSIEAAVTPGDDAQEKMRALNIKTLEGTATTNYTFDGQDRTAELAVPTTEVPAEGSVTTVATGEGEPETAPAEDGEAVITAGDFTTSLTTDTGFVLNLACTAPDDNTVGAIQVGEGTGDDTGTGDDGDQGGDTGTGDDGDQGTDDQGTDDQGTDDQGTDDQGTDDQGTDDQGTDDQGGDDQGGDDQGQDTGNADQGTEDQGQQEDAADETGQPEVPAVVQTDGGQMKDAGATNAALGLGALLLLGAGAGAVFAARRTEQD